MTAILAFITIGRNNVKLKSAKFPPRWSILIGYSRKPIWKPFKRAETESRKVNSVQMTMTMLARRQEWTT